MSVRELARRISVSPSLVSQIEVGRSQPSVKTLYAIAQELATSADELLFRGDALPTETQDSEQPGERADERVVQRADSRRSIRLESGVTWDLLTPSPDEDVEFLEVTYDIGGASSSSNEFLRHSGREYGVVLSGRLMVTLQFRDHVLGPGDSIAFDSMTPHRLSNASNELVHAIWFVVGRNGH